MTLKSEPVQPSIELTAFSCAHCGALTTQHWRKAYVDRPEKDRLPMRIRDVEGIKENLLKGIEDADQRRMYLEWADRLATNLPSVGDKHEQYSLYLNNVDVSQCYNCDKLAIWVGDHMIWPHPNEAPSPNPDLPNDVAADYLEAGEIVNASPRGAAALLRLAIQKLCAFLGETGKDINADIKSLVAKGLDVRVQQMLDVVRVVGNNAVHPGEMDLRDDRPTAEKLFGLVNLIAERMISQPKAIAELYESLPPRALEAIEKRDAPKTP